MTKRSLALLTALALASTLLWQDAFAETLRVQIQQATSVSNQAESGTRIAFRVGDFTLPQGDGRQIFRAFIEWNVSGLGPEDYTEYSVSEITEEWDPNQVSRGGSLAVSSTPAAFSEIGPLDYERNQGGSLRLDVTDLVKGWIDGAQTNHGLVIDSKDVTNQAFLQRASEATLVIRYGFLP